MMKTIINSAGKYIYDFLEDHSGMYYNRKRIEFVVNNDDSVLVNYVITDPPQLDYIEFGLCYISNNFSEFMRDFGFTVTHELKALSPNRLWEMYYKGKAEIYCLLSVKMTYFALSFRLAGNKMIVRDEYDNEYELDKILKTPKQFIKYTHQQCILTLPPDITHSLRMLYNGNKQVKL